MRINQSPEAPNTTIKLCWPIRCVDQMTLGGKFIDSNTMKTRAIFALTSQLNCGILLLNQNQTIRLNWSYTADISPKLKSQFNRDIKSINSDASCHNADPARITIKLWSSTRKICGSYQTTREYPAPACLTIKLWRPTCQSPPIYTLKIYQSHLRLKQHRN